MLQAQNNNGAKVSVVIATALAPERVALLDRAILTALRNNAVSEVIVVVNGQRFADDAFNALRARTDVRVEYLSLGSNAAAQRRGRELVTQPFFCFVDDDDELLPGSVASRLATAEACGADVVVCNGYRNVGDGDVPYCGRLPVEGDDLAVTMLAENWFASCAPLFRSESVGVEFFDGRTRFLEWTLLAYKLIAANRRFAFVTDFGFRINDTAISLSKDLRGVMQAPMVLREMTTLTNSPRALAGLRRRLARAHHACAEAELSMGLISKAWLHHFKSLTLPGGAAYWPYTWHLLVSPFVRSRR